MADLVFSNGSDMHCCFSAQVIKISKIVFEFLSVLEEFGKDILPIANYDALVI